MRILVLGGAGRVGSMMIPVLPPACEVRVLDLLQPGFECEDFIQGSLLDDEILKRSVEGMGAIVYAAVPDCDIFNDACGKDAVAIHHDLSVKGLHLALHAAHEAGIKKAVYLSTFNVYREFGTHIPCEDVLPGTDRIYGFTKILGEAVCRMFGDYHDMTVTVLRLYRPMPDLEWHDEAAKGPVLGVAASDLAEAIQCSLRLEQPGYQVFSISGDYRGERIGMQHAKEALGWSPKAWMSSPGSSVSS